MEQPEPSSLAAASALRRHFDAATAAWALTQVQLRRHARTKFPHADQMLFTRIGLEQATRAEVASWRAQQLISAGITHVVDLGCGIGSDAMAMVAAGLEVTAVEADFETYQAAQHNLALVGEATVIHGMAQDIPIPDGAAVFLDPARRTERGRSWNVADLSPHWDFVARSLGSSCPTAVKLGPGFPKHLIPTNTRSVWVSHHGDVVETSLYNFGSTGPTACIITRDGVVHQFDSGDPSTPLAVGEVGEYLLEPDGAVIRAGLLPQLFPDRNRWLLAPEIAYFSTNEALYAPWATTYKIHEILPFGDKALRAWVRTHAVGTLEIKVRGIEVDPARLRRRLKLDGPGSATVVLTPTPSGARTLVVSRLE